MNVLRTLRRNIILQNTQWEITELLTNIQGENGVFLKILSDITLDQSLNYANNWINLVSYLVHKRTSRNAFPISYIVFISFLSKKTPITFSSIIPRISYHIILGRPFSFCLNQKNNWINLKVVYRISKSKTSRVIIKTTTL